MCPQLKKKKLLSLGQLLEKGFSMSMKQNLIEVFDQIQRLVLRAPLSKNKTFKENLNAAVIQCLYTTVIDDGLGI